MLLVREELRASAQPGPHALSIGVFDGVHAGHKMLVQRLIDEATARNLKTGVVTFHPHPVTVIRPDAPFFYIESLERRVELLREAGVDFVSVLPFTSELQQVSAEDFVRILVEEVSLKLLVVGADFHLGRGREGDVTRLAALGRELDFEVIGVELMEEERNRISSTRVRQALAAGDVDEVRRLLGRPFALRGPVLHGDERGRAIGFPTLNLGVSADRALPPDGVYVSEVAIPSGRFHATTNLGQQPTFGGVERRVEAHLLDFDGDIYGEVVTVELLHRLRDVQKFDGVESLVAAIEGDVAATREWFDEHDNQ